MLVSVIMPCCNSEIFIRDSIESVLGQSYTQLELIVVDDASSDSTLSIIKELCGRDVRLKLVELPNVSGGPARPRNIGLKNASGDYYAFIDSDDVWHPQKLELQLSVMINQGLNFISTSHWRFRDKLSSNFNQNRKVGVVERVFHRRLLMKNIIATSSVVISAELTEGFYFNEEEQHIAIEDYVAWLYLHQSPSIKSGKIFTPLVAYRLRDDSISSSKVLMAKKIFSMLSDYTISGERLGLRKYLYFMCYIYFSVSSRIQGN